VLGSAAAQIVRQAPEGPFAARPATACERHVERAAAPHPACLAAGDAASRDGVLGRPSLAGQVAWVVSFDERGSPTIIRTTEGKAVRSKGRVWVEPDTGRVTRTELVLDDFAPPVRSAFGDDEIRSFAEVTVTWRPEEALGAWVPAEMRERYEGPWGVGSDDPLMRLRYTVTGVASYRNVRRANVDVRLIVPK